MTKPDDQSAAAPATLLQETPVKQNDDIVKGANSENNSIPKDLSKDELKKLSREERKRIQKQQREANSKPKPGHCNFFMHKKQRYCKFVAASPDAKYCVVHAEEVAKMTCTPVTDGDGQNNSNATTAEGVKIRKRIPCPLDPNHSIYEDQLKSHLKKCSKRAQINFVEAHPCYNKNCNLVNSHLSPEQLKAKALKDEEKDEVDFFEMVRGKNLMTDILKQSDSVLKWFDHKTYLEKNRGKNEPNINAQPFQNANGNSSSSTANPNTNQEDEHAVPKDILKGLEKFDEKSWMPILESVFTQAAKLSDTPERETELLKQGTYLKNNDRSIHRARNVDYFSKTISPTVAKTVAEITENRENNKHHLQNKRLLELIHEYGMLCEGKPLFLEYGCGKAGLTRWLALAVEEMQKAAKEDLSIDALKENPFYVLIEREARRHKAENKTDARNANSEESCIRLRLDLTDFDLKEFVGLGRIKNKNDKSDENHVGSLAENKGTTSPTATSPKDLLDALDSSDLPPAKRRKLAYESLLQPQKEILAKLEAQIKEFQKTLKNDERKRKMSPNAKNFSKSPTNRFVLDAQIGHLSPTICSPSSPGNSPRNLFQRLNRPTAVVHAKHLCGGATDLALQSLSCLPCDFPRKVAIATCCHHRCDWGTFVGKGFLRDAIKLAAKRADKPLPLENSTEMLLYFDKKLFEKEDQLEDKMALKAAHVLFEILTRTASWAVGDSKIDKFKLRFGMMSKRLLDLGRVDFCKRKLGLEKSFVQNYVPRDISPENGLLVGTNDIGM